MKCESAEPGLPVLHADNSFYWVFLVSTSICASDSLLGDCVRGCYMMLSCLWAFGLTSSWVPWWAVVLVRSVYAEVLCKCYNVHWKLLLGALFVGCIRLHMNGAAGDDVPCAEGYAFGAQFVFSNVLKLCPSFCCALGNAKWATGGGPDHVCAHCAAGVRGCTPCELCVGNVSVALVIIQNVLVGCM